MKKQKNKKQNSSFRPLHLVLVLCLTCVLSLSTMGPAAVFADRFQEQINALNAENGQKRQNQEQLGSEATSLSDTIAKLTAEINAMQAKINENQAKAASLQGQIKTAEEELSKQKRFLGETIKAMYVEGDITTVEMLASSKDFSDFFDKQQYRESVRSKIKTTVDKITQLKLDLNTQKQTVEKLIAEQQTLANKISTKKAENNRILSLNQSEQSSLDTQIRGNSGKIAELRRQQAIENARHGNGIVAGDSNRGGYPAKWANAPQDSLLDSWGMYNRECVSYAAWKVHESGRFMPYWGGRGNANQWPGNTSSKGKSPRVGSVAVAYWGYYGHTMYVEAVSGNQVYVSQYNYGIRGEYSEMWINTSEIDWFLYF